MSTTTYRPDIDGLRAVAVMFVVAYHIGIPRFQGGFIGVDVFFVISGYLISSAILSDIQSSKFSLLSFYERRIRRIWPALAVMLVVTCMFAYKYLLPTELEDYAKSLLAATFSLSNVYFWHQSGYFDAPAAIKPLLHTWSLAVEEQFYLFFPVLLVLIRRLVPDKLRACVICIALLSFGMSAVGTAKDPSFAFYLAPTRAWELLLGTIISMKGVPEVLAPLRRNIIATCGIVLILAAGFTFSSTTPFPGFAALAPCVGATAIIIAGQSGKSFVGRALSCQPLVFIGLISYSLYLWHWPIIVFQGVGTVLISGARGRIVKPAVLVASLALATLSWKYVELPFRNGRFRLSGAMLFKAAFVSAGFVVMLGAGLLLLHGSPARFSPEAVRVASYLRYRSEEPYREGICFISPKYNFQKYDTAMCLHEDRGKKHYLLLGDSHAAQLWYGLSTVFQDANVMQATASGCKPTLQQADSVEAECRRLMDYIYRDFLPAHHVDVLLIAANWDESDIPRLSRTIDWAKARGLEVVVFGPMVQYDSPLPRLLAASIRNRDQTIPYKHRVSEYEQLDEEMSIKARSEWNVRYISLFRLLCLQTSCVEYTDSAVPLQFDGSHLTSDGSILLARRLSKDEELP